jgi:hypothetical protein
MQGKGFWIKDRDIFELENSHIRFIAEHAEMFGFEEDEIKREFKKHKEPLYTEGQARKILIKRAAKRGFIRVRHYLSKEDYWAIQCDSFIKRRESIYYFIDYALEKKIMSRHDALKILSYENDLLFEYSWQTGGVSRFLKDKERYGDTDRNA